ncbi:MAG: class I tRNA ligase family protein [Candidatus Saccharimonadales bacterium]
MQRLAETQTRIGSDLDKYRFSDAYDTLYHFIWDDLADWYVEDSKAELNRQLLAYLLESVLIVAHPFAPFITETIWQTLAWEGDTMLAGKVQQAVIDNDKHKAADFAEVKAIVTEIRAIIKGLKVKDVTLTYTDDAFIRDNAAGIRRLAGLKDVVQGRPGGLSLTGTKHACWLNVSQAATQNYLKELQTRQGQHINAVKHLRARLDNRDYVKHAPKEVIEQTKQQLKEAEALLANLEVKMQQFTITPEADGTGDSAAAGSAGRAEGSPDPGSADDTKTNDDTKADQDQ